MRWAQKSHTQIVRGFKSTYKRHGTLNLFAALQGATGRVTAQITETKRREDFLGFMDLIVAETPADKELHVILDNYCTHKKCDTWLAAHPHVHFHFTPTSASWINAVEGFFAILTKRRLKRGVFNGVVDFQAAIHRFVADHNQQPKRFVWRADPDKIIAAAT